MDPNFLLAQFGGAFFVIALLFVFIECGLLFPFLPGDSLLFAMGLFIATDRIHVSLWVALPLLMVAAFLGNVCGYEIGRAAGEPLSRRDGKVLKRVYFDQTHTFFDKYGNRALVLGRFVPIVRTFITLVAGAGKMQRRRFFMWSGVGAVLWVLIVTIAGLVLGKAFPTLGKNIDYAILIIVILSLIPIYLEYRKHRRAAATTTAQAQDDL